MKRTLITILLLGATLLGKTQNVEKSVFGIQIGTYGLTAHNEYGLADKIALRSEVGLLSEWHSETSYSKTLFIASPHLSIEPRWYYNLSRRFLKGRKTRGNSGNYFSIELRYFPDWFLISNRKDVYNVNKLQFVPRWGMRRQLGKRFNFELGIGAGWQKIYWKSVGYYKNEVKFAIDAQIRFGVRL